MEKYEEEFSKFISEDKSVKGISFENVKKLVVKEYLGILGDLGGDEEDSMESELLTSSDIEELMETLDAAGIDDPCGFIFDTIII